MILIVEDNDDSSALLEKILLYHGYQTSIVSNGHSALLYCEAHYPSLILMDLSLPDMDGMEVTQLLRQKPLFRSIPIIALTAHVMHGIKEKTLKSGMNDFLAKPFLPIDLITIIKKHLR